MLKFEEFALIISEPSKKPCIFIFRYYENNYCTENKIVYSAEWRLMESLSCKGNCEDERTRCFNPIIDMEEAGIDCVEITFPEHPVHGALYQAVYYPGSPDWETGYINDWSWEMIPYKPEGKENESQNQST